MGQFGDKWENVKSDYDFIVIACALLPLLPTHLLKHHNTLKMSNWTMQNTPLGIQHNLTHGRLNRPGNSTIFG